MPAGRHPLSPDLEVHLEQFITGHRTAGDKPLKPAKPSERGKLAPARWQKTLAIGEIVAIDRLFGDEGIAPAVRYIYAGRGAGTGEAIVQDVETGRQ